jgi:folate-dependent tRNA-U54 methylase TrmFO/GidA
MKSNMALLPDLEQRVRNKQKRYATYAERAAESLHAYLAEVDFTVIPAPEAAKLLT